MLFSFSHFSFFTSCVLVTIIDTSFRLVDCVTGETSKILGVKCFVLKSFQSEKGFKAGDLKQLCLGRKEFYP